MLYYVLDVPVMNTERGVHVHIMLAQSAYMHVLASCAAKYCCSVTDTDSSSTTYTSTTFVGKTMHKTHARIRL